MCEGGRLSEGPFRIDESSGIVTLIAPLDKSRVSYSVNVTATDNGRCCGGTTSRASRGVVVFDVKDINNNAPRFTDCSSYSPTVLEKDNVGTFVIQARHANFGSTILNAFIISTKEVMVCPKFVCLSVCFTRFTDFTKTLLVLDFALQHAAISKFHAARRILEAVHLLSPGRCSGTDFLQKSGQTTHCRVSSLSLKHTISDSGHL